MLHGLKEGSIVWERADPLPSPRLWKYERQSAGTDCGSRRKSAYSASTNSRLTLFGNSDSPIHKGYDTLCRVSLTRRAVISTGEQNPSDVFRHTFLSAGYNMLGLQDSQKLLFRTAKPQRLKGGR